MPQVLVGFIGTGVLVFVIILINYLIAHDPGAYPFPKTNDAEQRIAPPDWWKPNPIDVMLLSSIRKLARKYLPHCHVGQPMRLEAAFNQVCSIPFLCSHEIVEISSLLISIEF